MGKRSAVVELFLGDMGSIQRELRPSIQREDQLTMETKLEQIAVKAVNQLPKSVVREIRTPRSVGARGGRPPPATRWDGKRSVAKWPKRPRPSSTLPTRTSTGLLCKSPLRQRRGHPKAFLFNSHVDTSALDFRRRSSRCETVQCGPIDDRNLPIWVNHASHQSGRCPILAALLCEVAAGTLDCSAVGLSPRPEQV
jgi:hypothetical protein